MASRGTGALLVVTVALSAPALAGPREDIVEARRLLGEVNEEKAIQVLSRALDRGDADSKQKGEIYVLLGIARFNLRDEEGADLAFSRAVENDPEAALPQHTSPKARAVF